MTTFDGLNLALPDLNSVSKIEIRNVVLTNSKRDETPGFLCQDGFVSGISRCVSSIETPLKTKKKPLDLLTNELK